MSAQMLEVSLLGVVTVLRLERDAFSMVKCLKQATNEYAPPPSCVLRAVLGRMQFTLNATRRTPHGASRLMQAMSAWLVKTRRAPSGVVGIRGSMVIRLRPCTN